MRTIRLTEHQQSVLNYIRQQNLVDESYICYPYFRYLDDGNIIYLQKLAFTWGGFTCQRKNGNRLH